MLVKGELHVHVINKQTASNTGHSIRHSTTGC